MMSPGKVGVNCGGDEPIAPAAAPRYREGNAGGLGVIMLHGLTASPTEVEPIAAYLEQVQPELTLSSPLLPGHGTSVARLRRTTAVDWTDAVADQIDRVAEHCRSIAIIGVSMGAVLAARAGITDPRVESVVMLSPMFNLTGAKRWLIPFVRFVKPYAKKSARSLENHRVKGLYSYDRYPLDSLMQLQKLGAAVHSRLAELTVPMLVAGGRQDPYTSWEATVAVACRPVNAECELVECPSSGHVLPHEPDAPELLEQIHSFLYRVHRLG